MSFKCSRKSTALSPPPKERRILTAKFEDYRAQALHESVSVALKKVFVDGVIGAITRNDFHKDHLPLAIERVEEIFVETIECDRERYLKKLMEQYALLKAQFIDKDKLLRKIECDLETAISNHKQQVEKLMTEIRFLTEKLEAAAVKQNENELLDSKSIDKGRSFKDSQEKPRVPPKALQTSLNSRSASKNKSQY